jgi:hypothetical protein
MPAAAESIRKSRLRMKVPPLAPRRNCADSIPQGCRNGKRRIRSPAAPELDKPQAILILCAKYYPVQETS